VDGDEIAFGDHETGFVVDVLRETCRWKSEIMASSTIALLR